MLNSCAIFLMLPIAEVDVAGSEYFESRIRPALVKYCFECHADKTDEPAGELRLDRSLTEVRPLIVPGNPDESQLIDAIRYSNSDLQMPPNARLPAQVIRDFETWVRMGAPDPRTPTTVVTSPLPVLRVDPEKHWAFQAIQQPDLPSIHQPSWGQSPLDFFVLAKLEALGIEPLSACNKNTLLRRTTFDLTGLPPTRTEIEDFLRNQAPDAFERSVDRLLASPAYGERWARHWLDVARYGDCNGADESRPFPVAYHFRNYTIEVFNQDIPFDRFITEQLAGDLIPHDGINAYEPLVGTGFLVLGTKILAEQDAVKMDADIVDEQIDTVGRALLGLTLGCARCHDHKFDPIPTADYYALAGIFHSTKTMASYGQWLERPAHTKESLHAKEHSGDLITQKRASFQELQREMNQLVEQSSEVITRDAENFERGNVGIETTNYGKDIGIIGDTGVSQLNFAEYDIKLKTAGSYLLQIRYAAATARPGRVHLNQKVVQESAISQTSGGWHPKDQNWFSEGSYDFQAGTNCLRIESEPSMPHIDKWRLIPSDGNSGLSQKLQSLQRFSKELAALEMQTKPPLQVMAVTEGTIQNTRLHQRGSHLRLGEEIPRQFLQAITGISRSALPGDRSGRLEFARWMTNPHNPLTSRVIANRLWRWHFGRGIVATTENFGANGQRPTHPELLDFLAQEVLRRNWSLKSMHRAMLQTSVYRLRTDPQDAHTHSTDVSIKDPQNHFHWRADHRRLEAEAIRDALLLVSQQMEWRIGAAPLTIKTIALSPEDLDQQQNFYDESRRRTIYLPVLRTNVYDFLTLLDFANPDFSTGNRVTTTVPTQALLMMNSPFVANCAQVVATNLLLDSQISTEEVRFNDLCLRLFGRPSRSQETAAALRFLTNYTATLTAVTDPQERVLQSWAALCQTLMASNDFVFLD